MYRNNRENNNRGKGSVYRSSRVDGGRYGYECIVGAGQTMVMQGSLYKSSRVDGVRSRDQCRETLE